jgi:hypothetical protein
MKPLFLKLVAFGSLIALAAILCPDFTQDQTPYAIIFSVLAVVGIGVVALILFGGKRKLE